MMKKKKNIILIISLVLTVIVGIISYNLFRKEISTQQVRGSSASTANADTTATNAYDHRILLDCNLSGGTIENEEERTQYLYVKKNDGVYKDAECTDKVVADTDGVIILPESTDYIFKEYKCTDKAGTSYTIDDKGRVSTATLNYLITANKDNFDTLGGMIHFTADWDYKLTFINKGKKVELSATRNNTDTVIGKLEEAEAEFEKSTYKPFGTYRENGYKYEFPTSGDITSRWSRYEDHYEPSTSTIVQGPLKYYAWYNKTETSEIFKCKIDLNKNGGIGGPDGLYIVKNDESGKVYTDPSCSDEYEVTNGKVEIPKREGYKFNGTEHGSIDADGTVSPSLPYSHLVDSTDEVKWIPIHTITLNENEGSAGIPYLYIAEGKGLYYKSDCSDDSEISGDSVTGMPFRNGYTFGGYIVKDTSLNLLVINPDGTFNKDWKSQLINSKDDIVLEAVWNKIELTIKEVKGNPTTWTNQDVTLEIVVEGNPQLADRPYSFDGGTTWQAQNTKTYTTNTSGIKVMVKDMAGNPPVEYDTIINIDKIDKQAPLLALTGNASEGYNLLYHEFSSGSGIASFIVNGQSVEVSDKGTYKLDQDGTYTVKITDNAGNITERVYTIGVDNTKIEGNPTTWINQDVTLKIVVEGNQQLADKPYSFDGGENWQTENTKMYDQNTSGIEVRVKDINENIICYKPINIDRIDKQAPSFNLIPYGTNGYHIAAGDLDGSGVKSCTVNGIPLTLENDNYFFITNESGTYNIVVTDNVGNYAQKTVNIEVEKGPTITNVEQTPSDLTNQNVKLTVHAQDNTGSGIKEYSFDGGETWQTENTKIYEQNTSGITVRVKDNAENIGTYPSIINIDNIDKVAPKLNVKYEKRDPSTNYVWATISADKKLQVLDGWTLIGDCTSMEKKFTENFDQDITVKDLAGNTATIKVSIKIDSNWEEANIITFNQNGGTGGQEVLYYKNGKIYFDEGCTNSLDETNYNFKHIVCPTREGYIFTGYKINSSDEEVSFDRYGLYDINGPLAKKVASGATGKITLYAQWEGNQVAYKVEHYKEQEDKTYKIVDTENKTGEVGTTVTANKKTYEGYTYNSSKSQESGIVRADGSLVLKMYYDLNETISTYTVKYYKEDETGKYIEIKEDEKTETGTIGTTVTAKVKAYQGYMYNKEKSKESITGEVKEDGSLVLGVYYRKLKAPYIEITVKDETTQEVKEGVKVTLYDSTGKEIKTQVSDIIGKVSFENLEKGKIYTYKIEGDTKEYKFRFTEDGKIEYIDNEQDPKDDPKEDPKDDPKDNPGKKPGEDSGNSGSSTNQNQINGKGDDTKATSVIPKAGIKGNIILFVIVLLTSVIGISYIKYKRLKKIC